MSQTAAFDKEVQQRTRMKDEKSEIQKQFEDRDSNISFGSQSSDESEDEIIDVGTTRASFFDGKDRSSQKEFGVEVSANLSKRLLQKMEFGAMMKKQVSPVNNEQF